MDSLHQPIALLKERLRAERVRLTVQLALQDGSFWCDVAALRGRWKVEPILAIPSRAQRRRVFGVSLHLPAAAFPTKAARAASDDEMTLLYRDFMAELSDWAQDLHDVYERLVPADQRRFDRPLPDPSFARFAPPPTPDAPDPDGDLFSEHWAPFISSCVLFYPPGFVTLRAFADHVDLDPQTIYWAEEARRPDQPLRFALPGRRYLEDADAAVAKERRWWAALHNRAAIAPPGSNLGEVVADGLINDRAWYDTVANILCEPIPVHAVLDPSTAPSRRPGAPTKYDDIHALECYALKPGRTNVEVAQIMGLPIQGDNSKAVRELLKRAEKLLSGATKSDRI